MRLGGPASGLERQRAAEMPDGLCMITHDLCPLAHEHPIGNRLLLPRAFGKARGQIMPAPAKRGIRQMQPVKTQLLASPKG